MEDAPTPPRRRRPNRPHAVVHFKVEHLLAAAPPHAAEYHALLLDPRTTGDVAHAWLSSRGYKVSRSAMERHRRQFLQERRAARLKAEETRLVATAVAGVFKQFGPEGCGQFLLHGHQFLLFKRLMEMDEDGFSAMPLPDLRDLSKLVFQSIKVQYKLLQLQ